MGWFALQLRVGLQTFWVPERAIKTRLSTLCDVRPVAVWVYPLLFDLISESGERLLLRVIREFKGEPTKLTAFFGLRSVPEQYELVIVWRRTLIAG